METLFAITPCGTQKVLSTPVRRKYSTELSLQASFPSRLPIVQPFFIAHMGVVPLLISA